jgi:hypothetical protein
MLLQADRHGGCVEGARSANNMQTLWKLGPVA